MFIIKKRIIFIHTEENVCICVEQSIRAGFFLRLNIQFFQEKGMISYGSICYMASLSQLVDPFCLLIFDIS